MSAMPPLEDILNDTPATASPVESNFNKIETHINNELIHRDGSITMDAPLILSDGSPAASIADVSGGVPIGTIVDYFAPTNPIDTKWKLCNGQILNTSEFPELKAAFDNAGVSFDEDGDDFGGVQFRLPNYGGKVSVGYASLTAPFDEIGATGGSPDVLLPTHTHALTRHTHGIPHSHNATETAVMSHRHSINHDHPAVTSTENGTHNHNLGTTLGLYVGAFNNSGSSTSAGSTSNHTQVTFAQGGAHTHTVNLPNFSGNSGYADVSHDHEIADFSGTSDQNPADEETGFAGEDGVGKNYQPYLVMSKIMKVK